MAVWTLFLSTMELSPHSLTNLLLTYQNLEFVWFSGFRRKNHTELYRCKQKQIAIPIYISGRTSYFRVRLAFYPYPQVIPTFCNMFEFGPPPRLSAGLTLPMDRSPGFGSSRCHLRPFRLGFPTPSPTK